MVAPAFKALNCISARGLPRNWLYVEHNPHQIPFVAANTFDDSIYELFYKLLKKGTLIAAI